MEYIQYIVIILVTIVIAVAIIKSKRKDFKLDANKLVECLGGKENIIRYEVNRSRFIVELRNIEKVNKETYCP